jgi:sulfatase modifying factor 1
VKVAILTSTLFAALLTASPGFSQLVNYQMVTVGDAGNTPTSYGGRAYGGVSYEYQIGKNEVTIGQYTAFLNAVAKADPNELWRSFMSSDQRIAGISRSGSNGSYTYTVMGPSGFAPAGANSPGDRPITYVSWWSSARFANWMSNGQPTGAQGPTTTENGAYDLSNWSTGIAPTSNATNPNTGSVPLFRIPTEDEWYKAAYYKGGGTNAGYWMYATQSNSEPGNTIGGEANQANYRLNDVYSVTQSTVTQSPQNYLTNVGAFHGSLSAYGTLDQTGNVMEWVSGPADEENKSPLRGGWWGMESGGDASARFTSLNEQIAFFGGMRLSSSLGHVVVTGSQVFSEPVSGFYTVASEGNARFGGGLTGSLTVTNGTASIGGAMTGTIQIAGAGAIEMLPGASLSNALVSLEPGGQLALDQSGSVPFAAGNIGGLTVRAESGLTATVLSGSVSTASIIVTAWSPNGGFSGLGSQFITGDVLSFDGTGVASWVLQTEYDPSSLPIDEATMAAAGDLFLAWLDPATSEWVNSVNGNVGGTPQFFQRAWQPGDTLGSYGVDVAANTVWAVINHNSYFAVMAVPEPSTSAMALASFVCGICFVRRCRKRANQST